MNLVLKRKLCTLSMIAYLSFLPAIADEVYNPDILEGYVQQARMFDLSPEYISDVEMLLNNQIYEGRYDAAEKTAGYYVDVVKKYYGKHDERTLQAYLKRAEFYTNYLVVDKAMKDLKHAKILTKYNPENNDLKMSVNSSYANLYYEIKQPYDGINSLESLKDDAYGENIDALANKYGRIGSLYASAGEYKKAREYFNKAIQMYHNADNPNKYALMGVYSQLADISTPQEALKAIDEIDKIANSFPKNEAGARIDAKLKRLQFYNQMSRISDYKKLIDELAALVDKNKNPYRETAVAWLYVSYYGEQNNQPMVEKYLKIAHKYDKEFDWSKIPPESLILTKKYEYDIFGNMNNPEKAQEVAKEVLEKLAPAKKYAPVIYAEFLLKTAQTYLAGGNYKEAEKYINSAEKIYKKLDFEPKYEIAKLYNNYSELYRIENNSEKTMNYTDKAVNIYRDLKGDAADEVLVGYIQKANLYMQEGNKAQAIDIIDEYVKTVKGVYGVNHVKTYDAMFNAYNFYKNIDESEKANELYKKIISALDGGKIEGMYPMLFYSLYITEAHNYIAKKQYKTAAVYGEKAAKYAPDNGHKSDVYSFLAELYSGIPGKQAQANKYKKLLNSLGQS